MSKRQQETNNLPLLPLRDVIVFPHMVIPLFVGREKSIEALEAATNSDNQLFLVSQKDASVLNPEESDVYEVGTVVNIIQMLRLPDNTVKVLIEGKYRAKIQNFIQEDGTYRADVSEMKDSNASGFEIEAAVRSIKYTFEKYVKLNKRIPPELLMSISSITDPSRLADIIVAHLTMKIDEKQEILNSANVQIRLMKLLEKMQGEIEIINVEKRIRSRVKNQMERSQKEYYLNEQMNAIQKELGQKKDGKDEFSDMEDRLEAKNMPTETKEKVHKELQKLKRMSPMSAEAGVIRNYVDWMLNIPWGEFTVDDNNVHNAREILNDEHFGLEDVKDRIIEYLAVRQLAGDKAKGTVLCLAGPPGVGKTSIAKSLANSMGRNFVRVSLGGVRDEAEIRGHRRTYVGAMPGKIVQAMKKAGTSNPVILLDEIDKMSSDFKGDPASAMLEVLDPGQNATFVDHYIEADYDLSQVMFVMTANDIGRIPGPLRDRMEIINIPGYTPNEKMQIAKNYLVQRSIESHGLKDYSVQISDTVLMKLVRGYTKEAGVRNLERSMNTIARKIATEVVSKDIETGKKFNVTAKMLEKFMGPVRFEGTQIEEGSHVGLVNGLAYTSVGGELLNIEVVIVPGNGKIQITGKLGEVMQESARTALSYVRSISSRLGVGHEFYSSHDIHVHVPEGATPKDGPSAGITLATALTSAIARIPVFQDVAMTGEVTLRGRVLPIGGLKEKLLGAKQAGVKTIVIPKKNEKDLAKVPKEILSGLDIHACESMEEVLKISLELKKPEEFMNVVDLKVIDGEASLKMAN